ncbi:plasmid maintenance protein [Borreliella bavariensis]|uniref:plasmid maintenance protein n=1 Tax=Borreliella bavariensis TaxID=664662 RepID=UPI001F188518|nr:plasmid maintenance protein [Borreliella bavariensis]
MSTKLFDYALKKILKINLIKKGSVDLREFNNNKNNNIKEENNIQIEKCQLKKYFNKCNFLSKNFLNFMLKHISL